jgi:hypothetical protein
MLYIFGDCLTETDTGCSILTLCVVVLFHLPADVCVKADYKYYTFTLILCDREYVFI